MMYNSPDSEFDSLKNKRCSLKENLPPVKTSSKLKTSNIRRLSLLFNTKITQIIKRDGEVGKYIPLINDSSPETTLQPIENCPKPVPMPTKKVVKRKAPLPTPRKKLVLTIQTNSSACFAPEDVFAKLSVKEKALLYTKFVDEMTKRNPKFGSMESGKNKPTNKSEVIEEKQVSVKALLDEIEFNSVFPKPAAVAAFKIQRMDSMKRACAARRLSLQKSTEVEDNLQKEETTIQTESTSLATSQSSTNETSAKNEQNTSIFRSQEIENLFYSWLKEKHDNDSDNMNNQSQINALLEEAIAELENPKGSEAALLIPRKLPTAEMNDNSPSTSSAKPPEAAAKSILNGNPPTTTTEESESGVSSLPKITSEESPLASLENEAHKSENGFDFTKSLVPLRKKKLRRNIVWKKDAVEKEVPQTTSTDSDTVAKQIEAKLKNNKSAQEEATAECKEEPCVEMNQSFFKSFNSPRKIKSVYTLTINDLETPVCSPRPSLNFAKQQRENRINSSAAKKRPLSDSCTDQGFETAANDTENSCKKIFLQEIPPLPASQNVPKDNIIDNISSTVEQLPGNPSSSPNQQTVMQEKPETQEPAPTEVQESSAPASLLNQTAGLDKAEAASSSKHSIESSTPIKSQEQQHKFTAKASAKRLFSPIAKPIKNRRISFYDIEARRSSLAMQVIREDQPLETLESQTSYRCSKTEQELFGNASAKPKTTEIKVSQYWIKCGDFTVSLDIDYISSRRLQMLYEIFSQNGNDAKDLHFGIDNNKFSIHDSLELGNISTHIPPSKECSHYWFSTGELCTPFNGRILPPHKIQRIFRAIKETVLETGVLRFGVDDIEFSSVPEFWYQQPKFSVDSQYSMLVGLQSGNSDGLEGRSKYAWPHSKPVRISDLDRSDNEIDNYEDDDYGRLSLYPFASNHYDLASLGEAELDMPRNSLAMMNVESFWSEYDNEPLDQLFEDRYDEENEDNEDIKEAVDQQPPVEEEAPIGSLPDIVQVMQNEKQRLSGVQEQLSQCAKPSYFAKDSLDIYKNTPDYVVKLKDIVADISNIVCSNTIDTCSVDELENYLYFLSRYAEICLKTCDKHIDEVLSALSNHEEIMV